MNIRLQLFLWMIAVLLSGCASPPQQPVSLSSDALNSTGRIGVAMTVIPTPDTSFPGADCLLCQATALIANSTLTAHTKTLTYEDLPNIKNNLAELLRKKGLDVTVIEESLDVRSLKDFDTKEPNLARKNFAPLQQKYNVNKLLVIDITAIGFIRRYSAYIPTSDPLALVSGAGYLVNLKNNAYEWYLPLNITKSADQNWDEPPKYPGLTNAYFQALESGKDQILDAFRNNAITSTSLEQGRFQ